MNTDTFSDRGVLNFSVTSARRRRGGTAEAINTSCPRTKSGEERIDESSVDADGPLERM